MLIPSFEFLSQEKGGMRVKYSKCAILLQMRLLALFARLSFFLRFSVGENKKSLYTYSTEGLSGPAGLEPTAI